MWSSLVDLKHQTLTSAPASGTNSLTLASFQGVPKLLVQEDAQLCDGLVVHHLHCTQQDIHHGHQSSYSHFILSLAAINKYIFVITLCWVEQHPDKKLCQFSHMHQVHCTSSLLTLMSSCLHCPGLPPPLVSMSSVPTIFSWMYPLICGHRIIYI